MIGTVNTQSQPQFSVLDDVLAEVDCVKMRCLFDQETFTFIQNGVWKKVFRISDGNCLKSDEVFSGPFSGSEGRKSVPVGNVLDQLSCRILSIASPGMPFLGSGKLWDIFSMRMYRYPVGSGLSWHNDGQYAGAFIYYAHEDWPAAWGGELLIAADGQLGDGIFVAPRPNRLVSIKGGVRHAIKKVEQAAGEHHRLSVAGFFFSADALQDVRVRGS